MTVSHENLPKIIVAPVEKLLTVAEVQKPAGWGTRHTLVFLSFWGFAISYAMR